MAGVDVAPPPHVGFEHKILTACRRKSFVALMIEPLFARRISAMAMLARADQREALPAMAETSVIDAASKRLMLALDALDAAIERRREAERDEEGLVEQLHALGSDRSRLASDLDSAVARTRSLETTNREIARRLDVAIDTIRTVLDADQH